MEGEPWDVPLFGKSVGVEDLGEDDHVFVGVGAFWNFEVRCHEVLPSVVDLFGGHTLQSFSNESGTSTYPNNDPSSLAKML